MLLMLTTVSNLVMRCEGLDNGVARTPPMGWLSWERFECRVDCLAFPDGCINEDLYTQMADRLVSDGYAAVGYKYVNVDDCWAEMERGPDGSLVADHLRFPSGMKALGDAIHAKGLLFGLYGDIGSKTCGGYPGTEGHFDQDAQTIASWGVDSWKMDGCFANYSDFGRTYPEFGEALNRTGRPILYGCSWPAYVIGHAPFPDIAKHCNLWRAYNDIYDNWDSLYSIISWWTTNQAQLITVHGPGQWNDPDMVIGGNFGLSEEQAKLQMSVWSILAAPLFLSVDLRTVSPSIASILKNEEVIAVDQDPLGIQGTHFASQNNFDWWSKRLSDGTTAVTITNVYTLGGPRHAPTKLSDVGMKAAFVRDLWSHTDLGLKVGAFDSYVHPSGAAMYKLSPYPRPVSCSYDSIDAGDHTDTTNCNSHQRFQQWLLSDDNTIRLASDLTFCLTVGPDAAPDGEGGTALSITPCGKPSLPTQLFAADDAQHIVSAVNGHCLTVPLKHSLGEWNSVNLATCNDNALAERSKWITHVDGTIESVYDGMCLSVCHWDIAFHH